ncbi:hypothetical protein [Chromobacterium haemolyticum]|uniref:hypothetical protein n=1 Tax=Chromobacterium haemolyticum TaxID=394935 RepID=UPI0015C4ABB6|nr:hypothetical protein [Chromobacterium haemolyticum]
METPCRACGEQIKRFRVASAEVFQYRPDAKPRVDLELVCPHCGKKFNAFVDVDELMPL